MAEVMYFRRCGVCMKPDRPGHACILPGLPGGLPLDQLKEITDER